MKTTSVLSALAVALPAFAAPSPSTTAAPGSCPGANNQELNSNNNIEYTISCGSEVHTDILRTTDTEVGIQGCLTACDGTTGCNAVSFIPSGSSSLKGSCQSRTKGSLHIISDNNQAVAIRVTPEDATTITSWPTATAAPGPSRKRAETPFGGIAIHSGSEIQNMPVNANGTYFWLNRGSETYTPSNIPATNQQNNTLFLGGDFTLYLDVAVPGGQQVYVDDNGRLRYTVPHSADTGSSKVDAFTTNDGHLQFENSDFYACGLGAAYDNAYEVYAQAYSGDLSNACISFAFRVFESADAISAYEYA